MKKLFRYVLIIALLALLAKAHAAVRIFYVSQTDGSDSYTVAQAQSFATPWKTLAPLRTNQNNGGLIDGDSIAFKCGDKWFDTLVVTKGLHFGKYGTGDLPVISGFVTVASWTSLGNGIWESNALAVTGSTVNMVVINGQEYAMGRFPNADASNGGYLNYEAHGSNYIRDVTGRPATVTNATWSGATVVARINHYTMERYPISLINGDSIKISSSWNSTPSDGYGYFLENDLDALDQFGEWYYNPSTKKIDVYFGASVPAGTVVQVSGKSVLFEPRANNTVINNLAFEGSNTYCIWNWNANVSGLTITNCKFSFAGVDAISMDNRSNLVIKNSTINWANGNGICMGNKDNKPVLDNNVITNIGTLAGMMQNINTSSNRYGNGIIHVTQTGIIGMQCTNNYVYNTGLHGIFLNGDSAYISHNTVDRFCTTLDDAGGIYFGNLSLATRTGVKILENTVSNGIGNRFGTTETSIGDAEGVYLDDGSNNTDVEYNTVYNCGDNSIYLHNSRKNTIKYNLCYNSRQLLSFQHDHVVSYTMDSTTVWGNQLFAGPTTARIMYRAKETDYNESFASFTVVCDSNYYCSPFNSEANIIQTNWFGHSQVLNYNLDGVGGWKATTGLDGNTQKTPIAVSDPSKIVFRVAGRIGQKLQWCGSVIDLTGASVNTGKQINPFRGFLGLRSSGLLQ